jgi:deoxycytidylate deaminase
LGRSRPGRQFIQLYRELLCDPSQGRNPQGSLARANTWGCNLRIAQTATDDGIGRENPPNTPSISIPSPFMFGSDHTELVFAFVASIGADLDIPENALEGKLTAYGYRVERIHVSKDVLPKFDSTLSAKANTAGRKARLMDAGNRARKSKSDILACGIAAEIASRRNAQTAFREKTAYIIHSLKHPDEVRLLWQIYPRGFYLIAMNVPWDVRKKRLKRTDGLTGPDAEKLMKRDRDEGLDEGQNVLDTFHLADFFVGWAKKRKQIVESVHRFVDLVFGNPHLSPTFGEYAMFMAFAASTRSADLSRQVGAVITRNDEILGNGANDCPRKGGGLYWPIFDKEKLTFLDVEHGRDHMRGEDSNRAAQQRMIDEIVAECASMRGQKKEPLFSRDLIIKLRKVLGESKISDLTEFGRVVHAEMETLLSCARRGIPTVDATIYCTTFPCHNCAKHIVAAGIAKVVFIEPYDKSLAIEHHNEVIEVVYPMPRGASDRKKQNSKVRFEPFFGVGPRRFLDLFSLKLSVRDKLKRKDKNGKKAPWTGNNPRVKMRHSPILRQRDSP